MTEKRHELVFEGEMYNRLMEFKGVFDAVMEEETEFNFYLNVVLQVGLEKMYRDVIPEGMEWSTLLSLFSKHGEIVCELLSEIYADSGIEEVDEERERVKETLSRYIR